MAKMANRMANRWQLPYGKNGKRMAPRQTKTKLKTLDWLESGLWLSALETSNLETQVVNARDRSHRMTTTNSIRDLAAILVAMRPDWDTTATHNYLAAHLHEPLDTLGPAAIRCAANPNNRTPATLQWLSTTHPEPSESQTQGPQPKCYICGLTRDRCAQLYDKEIRLGIPDAHRYESADTAETFAVGRQITAPPATEPARKQRWRRT